MEDERDPIDSSSVGFVLGCIISASLLMASITLMWWRLRRDSIDGFLMRPESVAVRRPVAVLVWRLCALVLVVTTLCLAFTERPVKESLRFYTRWNYVLLTIYISLATAVSVVLVRKELKAKATSGAQLSASASASASATKDAEGGPAADDAEVLDLSVGEKRLLTAHFLLAEIEVPAAMLVSVIFYAFLAKDSENDFSNTSQHALNSFVALVDFFLASYTINKAHWPICFIVPGFYLAFHLAFSAARDKIAYDFLNSNEGTYPVWVVALALLGLGFFFFTYALSKLKVAKVFVSSSPTQPALSP